MDKRRFLKAIGMTSVASLLAAPFFPRSAASSAFAQDGSSIEDRLAQLQEKLEKEIRDREAAVAGLSNSFIGSVVAIPYASLADVPKGWHLCDGSAIPQTDEYKRLCALGLKNFPDYRGVFLRGLDDGAEQDPGRGLNTFQDSENKAHAHACNEAGNHSHGMDQAGNHTHSFNRVGNKRDSVDSGSRRDRFDDECDANPLGNYMNPAGNHTHGIHAAGNHAHGIQPSGIAESRPKNVSVRYIIKYA